MTGPVLDADGIDHGTDYAKRNKLPRPFFSFLILLNFYPNIILCCHHSLPIIHIPAYLSLYNICNNSHAVLG